MRSTCLRLCVDRFVKPASVQGDFAMRKKVTIEDKIAHFQKLLTLPIKVIEREPSSSANGRLGGLARMAVLSPEQRSANGRKASLARIRKTRRS
jgi:hypothetical protein